MAYFDHSLTERKSLLSRLADLFETPFERRTRALSAKVAELRNLSDEELAAMGIARSEIVAFVFGAKAR